MNISDLIKNTLREIEEDQTLLSTILYKCLRIAHHIQDTKEIVWLTYNLNDYGDFSVNENLKSKIFSELNSSFGEHEANEISTSLFEEYKQIRKIEFIDPIHPNNPVKKNTVALSVNSIENRIMMFEKSLKNNSIPEGLHSVDLFYKLESQQKINQVLESQINQNQNILSKIKQRAYSKLIEFEMELDAKIGEKKAKVINNNKIFIIHGHEEAKWRELKSILSDHLKLVPIILNEQPDKGKTIIEKFEHYAEQCCYAFAIFTPDDIVENNGNKYFQARPNVIYELGWFTAFLGRNRVCVLLQDDAKMDIFSDFQGVIQKRFYKNINEKYREIQLELKDCEII